MQMLSRSAIINFLVMFITKYTCNYSCVGSLFINFSAFITYNLQNLKTGPRCVRTSFVAAILEAILFLNNSKAECENAPHFYSIIILLLEMHDTVNMRHVCVVLNRGI